MARASGFECPKCESRERQLIESADIVHILALRCVECGTRWAVENAHPTAKYNDAAGRVEP